MRLGLHSLGICVCIMMLGLGIYSDRITKQKLTVYQEVFTRNIEVRSYHDYLKLSCKAQKNCTNPVLINLNKSTLSWSDLEQKLRLAKCHSYLCLFGLAEEIGGQNLPDSNYNQKHADPNEFFSFVMAVKKVIPLGSGLIVPPYLNGLRDVFEEYDIFFVDKDDGNLILGGKKIGAIISSRMKLLLGDYYYNLAPLTSGLLEQHMRSRYLDLKASDFYNVKNLYENYNFIMVESEQTLDLDLLVTSQNFSLYRLD